MNEPKDEGVTFDKAMEVHRLAIDDCLSPTQIAEKTGIDIFLVGRILAGRIFPGGFAAVGEEEMKEHKNTFAKPEDLKPCPFCGSTRIGNVSAGVAGPSNHWHAGDEIFAVNCKSCGASVPNRYQNQLVVDAWNRRTP